MSRGGVRGLIISPVVNSEVPTTIVHQSCHIGKHLWRDFLLINPQLFSPIWCSYEQAWCSPYTALLLEYYEESLLPIFAQQCAITWISWMGANFRLPACLLHRSAGPVVTYLVRSHEWVDCATGRGSWPAVVFSTRRRVQEHGDGIFSVK